MLLKVILVIFIGFLVSSGAVLKCQSCRGTSCNNVDVPMVRCNRNINKLPYNFESTAFNLVNAEYACVSLEYAEDTQVIPVRQCHLISEGQDLCHEIETALPVWVKLKQCHIQLRKSENDNSKNDIYGKLPPETTTPKPTTTEPTTPKPPTPEPTKTTPTPPAPTTPTTPEPTTSNPPTTETTTPTPPEPTTSKPTTPEPTMHCSFCIFCCIGHYVRPAI